MYLRVLTQRPYTKGLFFPARMGRIDHFLAASGHVINVGSVQWLLQKRMKSSGMKSHRKRFVFPGAIGRIGWFFTGWNVPSSDSPRKVVDLDLPAY